MILSRKIALNTIIQVVAKVITVSFTLLTTILLTGYLGKEGYGDYIYVITLALIFGAFADWGTATIGVREVAKETKEKGKLLANILVLRMIFSLLAAILLLIAANLVPLITGNPAVVRQAIRLASLVVIFNASKISFSVVFQSKLQMEKMAIADIASSFLILAISWFFIHQGYGLISLVGAVLAASIVSTLIAGFLALKSMKYIFQLDRVLMTRLLSESLPMGAVLFLFTADNKIDTVMLGLIKGSAPVGIYGIAYRIYDVLILGAAYLMNVLLPVISRFSDISKWKKELQEIYQKAFDILLLAGISVVILVWIFAPLMVRILTQQRFSEFSDAVNVLRILSLAMFVAYFNHLTGYTIVALGRQRPYLLVAFFALVFNVLANLVVIPRFSYFGAAVVTLLTEAGILLITTIFTFRFLGFLPSLKRFPQTAMEIITGLFKSTRNSFSRH